MPTMLVTGASGNMGQRVLELLLESNPGQIIAATRTPEKLKAFSGIEVRHADFDDPWHPRFRGWIACCSLVLMR
jgi:NAD(P)H dehydrogenase (quinone)